MEFDAYVAARRTTLVRACVLLGCPEDEAPRVVADVLVSAARQIRRAEDPDPGVYQAMMTAIGAVRGRWPVDPELPQEDRSNEAGLAVRRSLAAMDRGSRDIAVLAYFADLAIRDTTEVLGVPRASVRDAATGALAALGTDDGDVARELMVTAAGTVEVDESARVMEPAAPRRWPWVVGAAAAVTAVIAVVTVVASAPDPRADSSGLSSDQVPSLFGYDATAARNLLAQRGVEVVEQPTRACEPVGKVVGTVPPTGSLFERGDRVTISTAAPSDIFCMAGYTDRSDAWEFVDFATGRGPAPRFAPSVNLVVDGSLPATLNGADATNPGSWGPTSALTELSDAADQVIEVDYATYSVPTLNVSSGVPPRRNCGVDRPAGAGQRPALSLSIEVPTDGDFNYRCPVTVDLYRTGGLIDAVVLYTAKTPGTQS